MNTDVRKKILNAIKKMHPSDAIALIESVGKELRQANSIRINNNQPVKIDSERPDLIILKDEN